MKPTPPRWTQALLRMFLEPADADTVTGDLLEEYRDAIHPSRGQPAADAWYAWQVLGFVLRTVGFWAALFAAAGVARTALDWFAPPLDFHTRATVSTFLGMGLLLATGVWASKRSDSLAAGALAGVATASLAAVISVAGAAMLLALWHDPATMAAIRHSGGLDEVFVLPFAMIVPGTLLGAIGGVVGIGINRLRSA